MWRNYASKLTKRLLLTLHILNTSQDLLKLLRLSFNIGSNDREQVLVVTIHLFESQSQGFANCVYFAFTSLIFFTIDLEQLRKFNVLLTNDVFFPLG